MKKLIVLLIIVSAIACNGQDITQRIETYMQELKQENTMGKQTFSDYIAGKLQHSKLTRYEIADIMGWTAQTMSYKLKENNFSDTEAKTIIGIIKGEITKESLKLELLGFDLTRIKKRK